jgi:hypothetical protein
MPWQRQARMVLADQKPESARMVSSPLAPGAADPGGQLLDQAGGAAGGVGPPGPLAGVQDLAAVGAAGQQRVVAEGVGGAAGRRPAWRGRGPRTPPSPGRWSWAHHRGPPQPPTPGKDGLGEPVQLADVPKGEGAQEDPDRGGGHDPLAQRLAGGAAGQQVGVVEPSPPASIACTRVSSLRPGRCAPARSPRSISASAACSMPSRSARLAASSPALATAWVSSKQVSSWSRVWQDAIEHAPS